MFRAEIPRGTSTSEEPMRIFALVANPVTLPQTYTAVPVTTAVQSHSPSANLTPLPLPARHTHSLLAQPGHSWPDWKINRTFSR